MYSPEGEEDDIGYFFTVNGAMFLLLILALDLVSIFFEQLSPLIYGLLLTSITSVPYHTYKEMKKRSGNSISEKRKYLYLLLSITPLINIVFSVVYTLRRRRIEAEMSYRPDWWKGIVIGIIFYVLSIIFPIALGGSGETIEEQLRNTGPELFKNLGLVASWLYWAIIPPTIYFDRKYLEKEKGISIGKYLNIVSFIPYLSFVSAIIYLSVRYVKTR